MEYTWRDSRDGAQSFESETFCSDEQLNLLEITIDGKDTKRNSKIQVESASGVGSVSHCYRIVSPYENPIPKDSQYDIKAKFSYLSKAGAYLENGKWIFKYSTSLPVTFYLPEGYGLIHASHPVNVKEQGGTVYIEENSSGQRTIELRTKTVK